MSRELDAKVSEQNDRAARYARVREFLDKWSQEDEAAERARFADIEARLSTLERERGERGHTWEQRFPSKMWWCLACGVCGGSGENPNTGVVAFRCSGIKVAQDGTPPLPHPDPAALAKEWADKDLDDLWWATIKRHGGFASMEAVRSFARAALTGKGPDAGERSTL